MSWQNARCEVCTLTVRPDEPDSRELRLVDGKIVYWHESCRLRIITAVEMALRKAGHH